MKFIVCLKYALLGICLLSLLNLFTNATTLSKNTKSRKSYSHNLYNLSKRAASTNKKSHAFSRYYRKSSASATSKLLARKGERDDDDIRDPYVVFKIAFASHKNAKSTCPYPLKIADSNCLDYSCDLNDGRGGEYIYLCVGKKKLSELGPEDEILNRIVVNRNHQDCGDLKLIKTTLKSSLFFSDEINICTGHDRKASPYANIKVWVRTSSNEKAPVECTLEVTANKYLCFFKAENAPKKIQFSELLIKQSEVKADFLGRPESVAEIDNDNTSGKIDNVIKKSIWVTKVKSFAWNLENKFSSKVDISFSVSTPFINSGKLSISSSFDMSTTENKGVSKVETELEGVDMTCLAPKGKHYKCFASINKVETTVPYTIKRTVTYYDGTIDEKNIEKKFEGIMSSAIQFERCCYRGCHKLKDNLCKDYISEEKNNICPKLNDVNEISSSTHIETGKKEKRIKLHDSLNGSIISDIKAVPQNSNCPPDYDFIRENDVSFQKASKTISVCVKKNQISNFEGNPINIIRISKNNNDCGTLKSASMSIYQTNTFLCYGYDATISKAPVNDIVFITKDYKKNYDKNRYDCDENLINEGLLCISRDKYAPKKIELANVVYDYTKMKKQQIGPPKKLKEFVVSSSSISEIVKITKRTESSLKVAFDFGFTIGGSASGKIFGVTTSAKYSRTTKNTQTTEKKDATERFESSNVDCAAQEKKKMKCITSVIEYKSTIPYTANLMAFDYEGKEILFKNKAEMEIKGESEEISSSNMILKSCCLEGCCTGEPNEKSVRPHCFGDDDAFLGKDVLCSEVEKCYTEQGMTGRKKRRRRSF